jgi:MerR family transcriptional regulator, copper efflux regulator
MQIRDVAKLFGVTTSKVRFLEAQGLVHPSRNPSGYRHYNQTTVERISFILQAQSFGFRIEELRRAFAECRGYALRVDFVIERMTVKLDELGRDIDRACATRDRLIEGINEVKMRLRAQENSAFKQRPVHPGALISLARLGRQLALETSPRRLHRKKEKSTSDRYEGTECRQ